MDYLYGTCSHRIRKVWSSFLNNREILLEHVFVIGLICSNVELRHLRKQRPRKSLPTDQIPICTNSGNRSVQGCPGNVDSLCCRGCESRVLTEPLIMLVYLCNTGTPPKTKGQLAKRPTGLPAAQHQEGGKTRSSMSGHGGA